MKAIIFGANGQDGYYLSQLCQDKGINTKCISRSGNFVLGDVSNYTFVEQIIKEYQPNYIFHLAAKSTTRHEALFENHETISTGTLNILEATYRQSIHSKVFIAGSGVQFHNDGNPISENNLFEASSAYAVARIQSVYAARYYRSKGVKAYVGYLFHHESPLRKLDHVSQKVVQAAKRIAQGSHEKLKIGNIWVEKEWTFAGDVVRGIMTLVEQDQVFEATIGSGQAYTIKDWIALCFSMLNLDWVQYVEEQKEFKPEYNRLVSDPSKMHSLGWQSQVTLQELASMMIDT